MFGESFEFLESRHNFVWIVMGGRSSKGTSRRQFSGINSSSLYFSGYLQQENTPYTPQHQHVPAPHNYEVQTPQLQQKLDRKYSRIADNYQSLEQVTSVIHAIYLWSFMLFP